MVLTTKTFLIVCPLVFLAGLVDSIGGGGGLISLPAYLLAGLPAHAAIATNKLSSASGTTVATLRFARSGLISARLSVPSVVLAAAGSFLGARLSLMLPETVIRALLLFVLPVAAFFVLDPKLFRDRAPESVEIGRRTYLTASVAAFVIGIYDGLYGPGTGTFLIIAFTVFARLDPGRSNAQAKVINLTTNITSLLVFLWNGQVLLPLGLAAAVCNMAGNYLGSGLALKSGARHVRPVILLVLVLLFVRLISELIG